MRPLIGAIDTPLLLWYFFARPKSPFIFPIPKVETTQQAQAIGTYETSIILDEDCCRLFTPPHPVIRPMLGRVRKLESTMYTYGMVKHGGERTERLQYAFP